jgi:hypothetical protein
MSAPRRWIIFTVSWFVGFLRYRLPFASIARLISGVEQINFSCTYLAEGLPYLQLLVVEVPTKSAFCVISAWARDIRHLNLYAQ